MKNIKYNNFIVQRLVLSAIFLAIICAVRIALSFIPGVELTTFLICLYALLLPFVDGLLIMASFILITSLILNFGPWYIAYLFIFPIDFFIIKLFRKRIKNKIIFSSLCGLLALTVTIGYFLSDWAFISIKYAVADLITAVPIAIIGMSCNIIVAFFVSETIVKLFSINSNRFYDVNDKFQKIEFNQMKKKSSIIIAIGILLVGISSIAVSFIYSWKLEFFAQEYYSKNKYEYRNGLLSDEDYNKIQSSLQDNQFEVVGIYGGLVFESVISDKVNEKLADIVTDKSLLNKPNIFYFNTNRYPLGTFLTQMVVTYEGDKFSWKHTEVYGKNNECAYIYDKTFTSGIDSILTQSKHIYQISFDVKDNWGQYCRIP